MSYKITYSKAFKRHDNGEIIFLLDIGHHAILDKY